ncbi:hypothetical protein Ae505Ps2_3307 [Pseudonocardia sp. Ae505_Ps2]|nr:hypothetical protein Ae505Ps2_3307 [Pseudonocardia sp. Ae505_Ps2]
MAAAPSDSTERRHRAAAPCGGGTGYERDGPVPAGRLPRVRGGARRS